MGRALLLLILLVIAWAADAAQVPFWAQRYDSERTRIKCVEFAREIARQASKDDRTVYFIVGFTKAGRPHAFVVVDGWAIDNGAISPRIFFEDDVSKYMRSWWISATLPKDAYLRIVREDANTKVPESD